MNGQYPPAPVGTTTLMRGSMAPIRFVYMPPIDCPCARSGVMSKWYAVSPAASERPVQDATVAGSIVSFASASMNMRCSITPWRNVSRNAARLLRLRYSSSVAPGTRSGLSGSALPAIAKPCGAIT